MPANARPRLADPRHCAAARFFLDDLYGPQDFAERDAQFARIVPALVRLFPDEVVATVDSLAALHALSESLDSRMGRLLPSAFVDAEAYRRAWQATGHMRIGRGKWGGRPRAVAPTVNARSSWCSNSDGNWSTTPATAGWAGACG